MDFLKGIKRLDLADEDRDPMIIIKGSPFSQLCDSYDELASNHIIKIFKIVNSKNNNKELNLVKALVSDEDSKQRLLQSRFICLNKTIHFIEDVFRQPTQCSLCKKFGHKEQMCE